VGVVLSFCAGVAPFDAQESEHPVHLSYPPPPRTFGAVFKENLIVVRGTIVRWSSEPYEMKDATGTVSLPSTAYWIDVREVFKEEELVAREGSQIIVRHMAFRAGDARGGVDDSVPPLAVGREYVLILLKGTKTGTLRLAYGANSVFERALDLVKAWGRSTLADRIKVRRGLRFFES
jgi:hypothetical protein